MIPKRKAPRASMPDEKRHLDKPNLDDPRVIAALKEYEAALRSRRPPSRSQFLAQHAEIAAALIPCLAGLELLHAAVAHMRRDAGDPPLSFSAEQSAPPLLAALLVNLS